MNPLKVFAHAAAEKKVTEAACQSWKRSMWAGKDPAFVLFATDYVVGTAEIGDLPSAATLRAAAAHLLNLADQKDAGQPQDKPEQAKQMIGRGREDEIND
ncbi:hypothetical protein [Corynebacterium cystitidis]|uniref:hypothetical protein n=1 Tax=Corynebacterium cystitidis TaxID=35757 RepID=UPI00211EDE3F|nr:hypothetical protein [Corynebacterium cystitidis]